jgi:3',5'-cyclic AMP phosphodiesterase CpdA
MFAQRSTGLDELIRRPRPTAWQRFVRAPFRFLAAQLYSYHQRHHLIIPAPARDAVSVVCVSDTHNYQPRLPDGDILIHAGDLTQSGSAQELEAALAWLRAQPHAHKIVIAGNHDQLLDPSRDDSVGRSTDVRASLDWGDITYLHDSSTTVTCANGRRLRIYGSPWSPRHGSWAFQ